MVHLRARMGSSISGMGGEGRDALRDSILSVRACVFFLSTSTNLCPAHVINLVNARGFLVVRRLLSRKDHGRWPPPRLSVTHRKRERVRRCDVHKYILGGMRHSETEPIFCRGPRGRPEREDRITVEVILEPVNIAPRSCSFTSIHRFCTSAYKCRVRDKTAKYVAIHLANRVYASPVYFCAQAFQPSPN